MTTETTEHYTRLEAGSMSHTHPDCGCWLARDENTGSVSLYHCPTHAAALEMAEALRDVHHFLAHTGNSRSIIGSAFVTPSARYDELERLTTTISALLRRIEGP